VVAATTDVQKLPTTIIGRFPVKPVLEAYTKDEAEQIAHTVAQKLGFGDLVPYYEDLSVVATASNGNPRDMRALLIALRDVYLAHGQYRLSLALDWVGVTPDGLTRLAQDYLITLLTMFEGKGGEKSIGSALNEPGPLRHTEQLLVQHGYLSITPGGREMTEQGVTRTVELLRERGLIDQ
jgi:Holliday junction resolvasome RuvABC ATP-dependent DNA helicase subunit